MSASNNLSAYSDCFEVFDRALQSENGAQRVFPGDFKGRAAAFTFRSRMNKGRQNDRDNNRKVHSDDPLHPLYGRSEYDRFTIKVIYDEERDKWLVQAKRNYIPETEIEDIPGDAEEQLEFEGLDADD